MGSMDREESEPRMEWIITIIVLTSALCFVSGALVFLLYARYKEKQQKQIYHAKKVKNYQIESINHDDQMSLDKECSYYNDNSNNNDIDQEVINEINMFITSDNRKNSGSQWKAAEMNNLSEWLQNMKLQLQQNQIENQSNINRLISLSSYNISNSYNNNHLNRYPSSQLPNIPSPINLVSPTHACTQIYIPTPSIPVIVIDDIEEKGEWAGEEKMQIIELKMDHLTPYGRDRGISNNSKLSEITMSSVNSCVTEKVSDHDEGSDSLQSESDCDDEESGVESSDLYVVENMPQTHMNNIQKGSYQDEIIGVVGNEIRDESIDDILNIECGVDQ